MGLQTTLNNLQLHTAARGIIEYFAENGVSLSVEQERLASCALDQGLSALGQIPEVCEPPNRHL